MVLPPDGDRKPDGYIEFYESGSMLSGTVEIPDPNFPQYRISGPSVARVIVVRAGSDVTIDLSIPVGQHLEVSDERTAVTCEIED
ncbi:MAG: hypothetical protein EOP84_27785 [Verrucomicrobiaceae bacterium]|nr:MAG: hypothetical protein EOP84_27785 [Verrucomicrobiaceae bacterium]